MSCQYKSVNCQPFFDIVSHSRDNFSAYFLEASKYILISGSELHRLVDLSISQSTENELATVLITETFLDLERNMGGKKKSQISIKTQMISRSWWIHYQDHRESG